MAGGLLDVRPDRGSEVNDRRLLEIAAAVLVLVLGALVGLSIYALVLDYGLVAGVLCGVGIWTGVLALGALGGYVAAGMLGMRE